MEIFLCVCQQNSTLTNVLAYLPRKYHNDTTQPHASLFDFYSGLGSQPKYLMLSYATFHILFTFFFYMYANLFS